MRIIGDLDAPPKGTLDPEILLWCETNGFILVTNNRKSMPRHLADPQMKEKMPGYLPNKHHSLAMTLKEQLLQAIEALPSAKLAEALTFVQSLSTEPSTTSAQSFLAHLKTIGTWSGNDLLDCLEAVQTSRGEAQFDDSSNPFD